MFVMLVTYFIVITKVLRNNHIKNQILLFIMIIMMIIMIIMIIMMIMMMMMIDRYGNDPDVITDVKLEVKIHNTQNQSCTSFHHIYK